MCGCSGMNNPALYVKSNPFQRRDAQLVLKKYGPQLAPGLAVLDVGCGTGDLTVDILAQACGDFRLLLGVDLSSHMVDFARRNFQTDRIFFDQLDIATTEVSTFRARWGSFDRIYSFYCLHWVKDLNRAVGNLGSLLATGGEMLLVFLAHNPIFEVYQRMAATSRWKVYMEDVDKFIPDTHNSPQPAFYFSQILQDNGLDVLSCETINLTYSFNNAQILKATMESVNPFSERITDPQERAEFLTDCLKEISTMRTNQNDYTFNYSLLVAQAERR